MYKRREFVRRPLPLLFAGQVRSLEDFDLTEQWHQGCERGGGQSDADFNCRPGTHGLGVVKVFGVVEYINGVGEADDGGDGGTGGWGRGVSHLQFRLAMEGESRTYIEPRARTAQTEIFLRLSIFAFHTNLAGRSGRIQSATTFRNPATYDG